MRTMLWHIADGTGWANLDEESPGTGKRRPGAHSLRNSAERHWLVAGSVPLNVVSAWLGRANVQITLHDLSAHRGKRLRHGRGAVDSCRAGWLVRARSFHRALSFTNFG